MALFYEKEDNSAYKVLESRSEEDSLLNEYCIPETCIYRYTSLNMFKARCSSAFESGTLYVAFHSVEKDMLDQIDRYREHQKSSRVLYDEELKLLIVKRMSGVLHTHAIASFSQKLLVKLSSMGHGLSPFSLAGMGGTRFGVGGGRQKEADTSFKPSTRVGGDAWPSFVIEVGVSETLSQLQCDARFWLTWSGGMTKVVFLMKIDDNDKSIVIEQWEDVSQGDVHASTSTHHHLHKVNRIELTQVGCIGAPLCVSLANILDVLPRGMAADATLVLTDEELNAFYARYWPCVA